MSSRFLLSLFLSTLLTSGCGESREKKAEAAKAFVAARNAETPETWWCATHGVPKSMCAQCDPKLAEAAKAKGDWCNEHQRPKSQCFICQPRLERRFLTMKNARFGKPADPQAVPGG